MRSSSLAPVSTLEAVVEEVVAFLDRLRRGRALLAAAAVDVEVREDAHEPRAQIRARRIGAPAAEGPRVGLLDEVLGLLARRDEPSRDPIDLIRQLQHLLLEANTLARLFCDATSIGLGRALTHGPGQ